jgi:lysine-specific demethylase 8
MFLFTLLFIQSNIIWISIGDGGNGFPKDMNLYVTFPPILERHDSIPLGHLRPLGWQRRAEAPILEDSPNIQPARFYHLFVQGNRSVVIHGIVPPLDVLWTDSYLSKHYGHLNITVAKRKQRLVDTLVKMSLKTFLEQYRQDDLYMNTIIPDEMKFETPLPSLINCGTFRDRLLEPILWISAGDTASLLFAHSQNTLHCVLDGRKDFIIYDTSNQYPHEFDLIKQSNGDLFSRIDVDLVNTYKYKRLHHLPWYWATLREGDCLFIPAYTFHQVRAHGRTIALSIDMAPPDIRDDFIGNDCEKNPPVYVSLNKGEFQWRYEHGIRHLSKRTITIDDTRAYLILLLGTNDQLYKDIFQEFYHQVTHELAKQDLTLPTLNDIWKQLNKDEINEEYITRSRLKSLTSNILQLLTDILQKSARIHDYDKSEL